MRKKTVILRFNFLTLLGLGADVMELVDMLDLGSSASRK